MKMLGKAATLLALGATACSFGEPDADKRSEPRVLEARQPKQGAAPKQARASTAVAVAAAAAAAPVLDRTVVTTTAAQLLHIYAGDAPEQINVLPGAIESALAAGLSGTVIDRDSGQPVANAVISVVGQPMWGTSASKADGSYRFVVNGGKPVTLEIAAPGYLSARRQMNVSPLQYGAVPKVALVLEPTDSSFATQTISFATAKSGLRAAAGPRWFRSDAVEDKDGARRVSVFFPRATQSKVRLASGEEQAASQLTVSAVEYTTGPNGLAAMPADLPPTSAYTYAVELRVNEGTGAVFDPPVPVYVDNFINLPVGATVPSGFYDRESSANGQPPRMVASSSFWRSFPGRLAWTWMVRAPPRQRRRSTRWASRPRSWHSWQWLTRPGKRSGASK